jgi:hypothetical protein
MATFSWRSTCELFHAVSKKLFEQLHAKPEKSWLRENGRRKHCRGTKSWIINLKEWIRTLFPGGEQKESSPFSLPLPPTKFTAVGKMAAMGQSGAKEKNKMAPNKVEDDNLQVL